MRHTIAALLLSAAPLSAQTWDAVDCQIISNFATGTIASDGNVFASEMLSAARELSRTMVNGDVSQETADAVHAIARELTRIAIEGQNELRNAPEVPLMTTLYRERCGSRLRFN